ncbi:VOC family protein [Roseococcus sp. SYP-B2431]|uniref:VOC family protein n=1 Tax=Roseococcus sp. SYP-B2431 TaxID=2496640 RepID=UPI00103B0F5A|nr:VOC family protein [Roseococcus sp. SYP-B2431]TCI00366.1 VOC family protein [Roseococcus sp. SYP-B2431]
MLDHVSITVNALEPALRFYDAVMGALGVPRVWVTEQGIGYGLRNTADDDSHSFLSIYVRPGVAADRRHWGFRAPDRAAVRAFHAAGLAHGGRDDGPPGPRPEYHDHYYGAFLLDPDGNRVEAVCNRAEA